MQTIKDDTAKRIAASRGVVKISWWNVWELITFQLSTILLGRVWLNHIITNGIWWDVQAFVDTRGLRWLKAVLEKKKETHLKFGWVQDSFGHSPAFLNAHCVAHLLAPWRFRTHGPGTTVPTVGIKDSTGHFGTWFSHDRGSIGLGPTWQESSYMKIVHVMSFLFWEKRTSPRRWFAMIELVERSAWSATRMIPLQTLRSWLRHSAPAAII